MPFFEDSKRCPEILNYTPNLLSLFGPFIEKKWNRWNHELVSWKDISDSFAFMQMGISADATEFIKGTINSKNHNTKHSFYIILIYSRSLRAIFENLQHIFHRSKFGCNKNEFFHWYFFCFYKHYSHQKIYVVTQLLRCYYTVIKGVFVKNSSH